MADYNPALKTIICHEGGFLKDGGLVDHPKDPGGITRYGISLRFLKGEGLDVDGDGDVDADDVRAVTADKAAEFYRQFFWNLVHGDQLSDQAVATKLFDMAVNVGPVRAIKLAQASAGVDADGNFGPQTFKALNLSGLAVGPLLVSVNSTLAGFYRGLVSAKPDLGVFLDGWLVRANCTLASPCRTCKRFLADQPIEPVTFSAKPVDRDGDEIPF